MTLEEIYTELDSLFDKLMDREEPTVEDADMMDKIMASLRARIENC